MEHVHDGEAGVEADELGRFERTLFMIERYPRPALRRRWQADPDKTRPISSSVPSSSTNVTSPFEPLDRAVAAHGPNGRPAEARTASQ